MRSYMNSCTELSKLSIIDKKQLYLELQQFLLTYRNDLMLPTDVIFGVEIEYGNADRERLYDVFNQWNCEWVAKGDETVTQYVGEKILGGEINSPILYDSANNWQQLRECCTLLRQNGADANDYTGMHIHIYSGIHKFNSKVLIRFLKLIIVYEKLMYRFGYGEFLTYRKSMVRYASPLSIMLFQIIQNIDNEIDYFDLIQKLAQLQFFSINFENVKNPNILEKNTYEGRFFNGSVNEIILQNNINFFVKLLLYAASDRYDEEFIDYQLRICTKETFNYEYYNRIYEEDVLKFCDLIFDNDFDKMCFLKQYFKDFSSVSYDGIEDRDFRRVNLTTN